MTMTFDPTTIDTTSLKTLASTLDYAIALIAAEYDLENYYFGASLETGDEGVMLVDDYGQRRLFDCVAFGDDTFTCAITHDSDGDLVLSDEAGRVLATEGAVLPRAAELIADLVSRRLDD